MRSSSARDLAPARARGRRSSSAGPAGCARRRGRWRSARARRAARLGSARRAGLAAQELAVQARVCGSGSASSSRRSAARSCWYCASACWRRPSAANSRISPRWAASCSGSSTTARCERLDRRRRVPCVGEAPRARAAGRGAPRAAPRGGRPPSPRSGPRAAARRRRARAPRGSPATAGLARAAAAASKASTSISTAPARMQHEHVVAQRQDGRRVGAGRLQRPAGDVERLVEVVGRRLGRPVGPQQLRRPLAVDAPLGRQREQLDQALGLAQAPRALGHDLVADATAKAPNSSIRTALPISVGPPYGSVGGLIPTGVAGRPVRPCLLRTRR